MEISVSARWIVAAVLMFLFFYGVVFVKGVIPSMDVIERSAREEARDLDRIQLVERNRRYE